MNEITQLIEEQISLGVSCLEVVDEICDEQSLENNPNWIKVDAEWFQDMAELIKRRSLLENNNNDD